LTSKDNLRIGRENFLHTVPEIPQRVATHSQLQDKYEALKPEVIHFYKILIMKELQGSSSK